MSHSGPECGMGTRFRIVPVRNWNAEILVHVGREMFLTRSEYDRYLVCYCDLGAQTREGGRGGGDGTFYHWVHQCMVLCRVIKPKLQLLI